MNARCQEEASLKNQLANAQKELLETIAQRENLKAAVVEANKETKGLYELLKRIVSNKCHGGNFSEYCIQSLLYRSKRYYICFAKGNRNIDEQVAR